MTVLALHDLGKVAASFQALNQETAQRLGQALPQGRGYPLRHDALGQTLILHLLRRRGEECGLPSGLADDVFLAKLLFGIATGHHGRPPAPTPEPSELKRHGVVCPEDMVEALALIRAMAGLFEWHQGLPDEAGLQRLSPLLNGLFTLCDWLGSAEAFTYKDEPCDLGVYWKGTALPTAERVLDEVQPSPFRRLKPRAPASFASLFPQLSRNGAAPQPSPLQALADRLFTAEALPDGPLLTVMRIFPVPARPRRGT